MAMASSQRTNAYRKTPSDHYRAYRSGVLQVAGQIGLVTMDEPWANLPGPLTSAIQLRLQQQALALQLHALSSDGLERNLDLAEWRLAWRLEGLLVYHQRPIRDTERRRMRDSGTACIWCNHNADSDCVYYDEHSAAVEAIRRLVAHGHRRIAFVSFHDTAWFKDQHFAWRARLAGYRHAMIEAGLTIQAMLGAEAGQQLAQALPDPLRPTAILTPGHDDALGAIHLACSHGLVIPRQLSLVTFGTSALAFPGMQISTMVAPTEFLGATAVDLLIRRLELGEAVPSVGIGYDPPGDGSILAPPDPA